MREGERERESERPISSAVHGLLAQIHGASHGTATGAASGAVLPGRMEPCSQEGWSWCAVCGMWLPNEQQYAEHLKAKRHKKAAKVHKKAARHLLYWVYQQAGAEAELRTVRAVLALPSPAWRLLEAFLQVPQEFLRTYFGERSP